MKKFLIFIFLLSASCSFDTKSGIWTDDKKLVKENKEIRIVFKKEKGLTKELNSDMRINLKSKLVNNSYHENLSNNYGRLNFNKDVKTKSKFKFKKIDNFDEFEPELIFYKNNFIFFDDRGNIINFDNNSTISWKVNNYSKQEKKLKPLLSFAINDEILIVGDNISKSYAIDLSNGNILWSKKNQNPFNSQIKIFNNNFYVVDFNNVLRCFSIKSGDEKWNFVTENNFLKSNKRNSLLVQKNIVFFSNTLGDVTAVNASNGSLIWQTSTQKSSFYEDAFNLISSDLVSNNNTIVYSNNRNELYSINLENGLVKWKQKINSSVRSVIINELIFTVSNEGYLFITDSKTGNIIRITDIFNIYNKKKRSKIKPIGFLIGINKIYLTTSHGRLLTIDIATGKTFSVLKIDNEKISRPFVSNKELFVVKKNSIIKLK